MGDLSNLYQELYAARAGIFLSWGTLFIFAAIPGPTAMAIMGISITQGRKGSVIFTTGCMLSSTMWGILATFGLSIWLMHFAQGIIILKIFGGTYMLWMAYKAIKSALQSSDLYVDQKNIATKNIFIYGLLMHATNPKAIFGWAAALTLSQTNSNSIAVLVFTLLGCLIITYSCHYAYALLFSSRTAFRLYEKAHRQIQGTLAVIFSYVGYRLFTE